jgi:hypothetical protein
VHQGLDEVARYYNYDNEDALRRAEVYVRKLIELADERDAKLYLTYDFDAHLHPWLTNDWRRAPWFSGMAQGEMLMLLSRLHRATDDDYYLMNAHRVFSTFLDFNPPSSSRTVSVDSAGYYWINEYPASDPPRVLNGFIFAVRGLYEYWRELNKNRSPIVPQDVPYEPKIKQELAVQSVLVAAFTTLRHHAQLYRRPGGVSVYCLGHRVQNTKYHRLHIQLLKDLESMTDEAWFGSLADSLTADHRPLAEVDVNGRFQATHD